MRIAVKLFARGRDLAGTDRLELELPEEATVRHLRGALRERCPALGPLLPQLLVAVNNDYADNAHPVHSGDEVACFPPVSGG